MENEKEKDDFFLNNESSSDQVLLPEKRIGFIPNLLHSLEFHLRILAPTLIACLLCNIFIVCRLYSRSLNAS